MSGGSGPVAGVSGVRGGSKTGVSRVRTPRPARFLREGTSCCGSNLISLRMTLLLDAGMSMRE